LRYRHARSGIEVLLTGRERFRPIEELNRLEFTFLVNRSDDDPTAFKKMAQKFRESRRDGAPYSVQDFHGDLIALVKYPEELKGRTEADLGLMADEVEHVIDRRQELDKGILPYEAVFGKDTEAIIDYIRKNRTPEREIRKALDYFEYTGMIDPQYKTLLQQRISAATAERPRATSGPDDMLYDKRVKEIVAEVLQKIPKERLTSLTITIALTPYINELGFSRLVKIRERILQLKEMMHDQ
jgi:U3 small nucleolar ribonucleoprotein component